MCPSSRVQPRNDLWNHDRPKKRRVRRRFGWQHASEICQTVRTREGGGLGEVFVGFAERGRQLVENITCMQNRPSEHAGENLPELADPRSNSPDEAVLVVAG